MYLLAFKTLIERKQRGVSCPAFLTLGKNLEPSDSGLGNAIVGSSIALGPVSKHIAVVANGVAGTAMQAFGDQLSSLDLAAVTTYQRNAFGNSTGDIVQASDLQRSKKAISAKSSMPDEAK